MEFDVRHVDLEQLADVATQGGIEALEEMAATGKAPEAAKSDEAPIEAAPTDPAAADPAVVVSATPSPVEPEHTGAVSTKDGKGTIPYSVLKGARERATNTEQENLVLRKQIEDLTQRLSNPTADQPAGTTEEVDAQVAGMREKAAQLKEEFPELADLLTGQIEVLQATRQQLIEVQGRYEAERQNREAVVQAEVEETIQEAIDGNPILTAWREKSGPEWDAAVEMDVLLRSKPEWESKSFSERFDKAVELVRVMHPEFEVPATPTTTTPVATSADLKEQAAPSDKRPPVNSLSDIPGGVPPAAGTREQIEELSGAALGNRFMTMDPAKIQDFLATLGT